MNKYPCLDVYYETDWNGQPAPADCSRQWKIRY
jgi:hypothetical protein